MEEFVKIPVEVELPKEQGKYIVFTETSGPMKGGNQFACLYTPKDNGKPGTWGCSNQIVTHWLKKK